MTLSVMISRKILSPTSKCFDKFYWEIFRFQLLFLQVQRLNSSGMSIFFQLSNINTTAKPEHKHAGIEQTLSDAELSVIWKIMYSRLASA